MEKRNPLTQEFKEERKGTRLLYLDSGSVTKRLLEKYKPSQNIISRECNKEIILERLSA